MDGHVSYTFLHLHDYDFCDNQLIINLLEEFQLWADDFFKSQIIIAGVPHGKDVEYLFGFPFFNTTLGNLTNIVPSQWDWTFLDRNISEFVQDMWVNFTRYG